MKIEDIQKMSNTDLGEELLHLCNIPSAEGVPFSDCYLIADGYYLAEHVCTKLDVVAEIEKIVIEKVSEAEYQTALHKILDRDLIFVNFLIIDKVIGAKFAMATARQRAEACLLALKTIEG